MIGKYERLDVVGHGASGIVYLARDTLLRRQVAIKEISAQGEERERFLEEARVLDRLRHPNIVEVHSVDTIEGKIVIDMEYIDGQNLLELLRNSEGVLAIDQALDIIVQVCDGLAYAQARHIVHRDIKPANILVTKSGQVKLVDFGLAEVLGTNSFVGGAGTYAYMAPEDFEEGESSDAQADLWAVGVILYEMLVGRRPFSVNRPKDPFAWKRAIEQGEIQPPSSVVPSIPRHLDIICLTALARDRNERYRSADELANAIRRFRREQAEYPIERFQQIDPTNPPIGIVMATIIGATDIDTFISAAPDHWEEARTALETGHLARWLWAIGEAPLAEIAQGAAQNAALEDSDADELLRDFLYRAGLDTAAIARRAANTGSSLLRSRAFDDAAASLMQAVRLDPSHVSYFRQLAKALSSAGDTSAAEAAIVRGLEFHPNDRALKREHLNIALAQTTISDDSVDFGSVRHGESVSAKITIRNGGAGVLQGRIVSLPGWVQANPMSFITRHRQPVTLFADTSKLWTHQQAYEGSVEIKTNGGKINVHVGIEILPPRPSFQQIIAWYLPLMALALAPLLASEVATLRHHHHHHVEPYYAVGLVVTGLLFASIWKLVAVADLGSAERVYPTMGALLTPIGIWLIWLNRDVMALWPPFFVSVIPAGVLLALQGITMLRSPHGSGRWQVWGAIVGIASVLLAGLLWYQTRLPVVQ